MTGVQSVERSFALLEVLGASDRPVAISELAARSGLPLGTVHRLLRTLVDLGYVRQEPSRSYAVGLGFLRFGDRAASALASWSGPVLEDLARQLGESVNLAALEGDHVVYLAHVPSSRSMRMFTQVGSRVAAHSTGVGKAILAEFAPTEAQALLAHSRLESSTVHTITSLDALVEELDAIRQRGYAMDDEEQELGVRCVAAAVPGQRLAVSVSGPTPRMSDQVVQRAVPLLQSAAAAIAAEMRR